MLEDRLATVLRSALFIAAEVALLFSTTLFGAPSVGVCGLGDASITEPWEGVAESGANVPAVIGDR